MTAVLEGALLAGVVDRMTRPDYPAFEAQLRSSGYCSLVILGVPRPPPGEGLDCLPV
jgi:hypothetical protein